MPTGPVAAEFDGTNDYLTRGAGLTGAADSKLFTVSYWLRLAEGATPLGMRLLVSDNVLGGGAASRTRVVLSGSTSQFNFVGTNAAGTDILNVNANTVPAGGAWYHVLASFDLGNAKRHIYVDNVSDDSGGGTFTNDTIDFTLADWGFAARPDGGSKFNGAIADFWYAPGVYTDLTVVANRRKFVTADNRPVYLGANGELPTGTKPLVFLSGAIDTWHTNKGTGGGFTENGAIADGGDFATGTQKCFNTLNTCQDLVNIDLEPQTLRFAMPTEYLPSSIYATPNIREINLSPSTLSLGADLGQRASLKIRFTDHPDSDTRAGYDKYYDERDYDPFRQGTHWGKFRARQPFIQGRPIRLIRGELGQALGSMETRHYVIESFDGPRPDGIYELTAKDVLKLADSDRAQAPLISNGFLSVGINSSVTSATLAPSGIGNEEYPASGHIAIGGKEIVSFTRSNDTLTITRGQLGTTAQAHVAQDRMQLVLRYVTEDPADIISDLLQTYAGVPSEYIPLSSWQTETATFLEQVYSANIADPTSVRLLISELIEQAALAIWWDDASQLVKLQVLREIATSADAFSEDNVIEGTLDSKEQPEKRLSQVWTYFGKINPLVAQNNVDNYRSSSATVDELAESNYGVPVIKKIFSRWIPDGGSAIAQRVNAIQLARFRDPPRRFQFDVMRNENQQSPSVGGGYRLEAWPIQDATGEQSDAPIQVTRVTPEADRYRVEAEEMLFTFIEGEEIDPDDRTIIFDVPTNNVNLRSTYDTLYPAPVSGDEVIAIINEGVIIGSTSTASAALNVGTWPAGVTINIIVEGRIQGKGGAGGNFSIGGSAQDGFAGGLALLTARAITLTDVNGEIWGGGGGGGGASHLAPFPGCGGGGAGTQGGAGGDGGAGNNTAGAAGTANAGGAGGTGSGSGASPGGAGGGPGLAGATGGGTGDNGTGGAAGLAISGIAFVTNGVGGAGDRRGGTA